MREYMPYVPEEPAKYPSKAAPLFEVPHGLFMPTREPPFGWTTALSQEPNILPSLPLKWHHLEIQQKMEHLEAKEALHLLHLKLLAQ